jgi:hypothetical protein
MSTLFFSYMCFLQISCVIQVELQPLLNEWRMDDISQPGSNRAAIIVSWCCTKVNQTFFYAIRNLTPNCTCKLYLNLHPDLSPPLMHKPSEHHHCTVNFTSTYTLTFLLHVQTIRTSSIEVSDAVDDLRWCDSLVFIYPTWWLGNFLLIYICIFHVLYHFFWFTYVNSTGIWWLGFPAILKVNFKVQFTYMNSYTYDITWLNSQGYIDRSFVPGVAFKLPKKGDPVGEISLSAHNFHNINTKTVSFVPKRSRNR